MQLSDHFSLEEMIQSPIAIRLGRKIEPTPEEMACLTALCVNVLEPSRTLVGIIHISSGLRPLWLNQLVGSSDTSQHPLGQAADCEPQQCSPLEMAQAIARSEIQFDQMIWEFQSWVHLSYDPGKHRQRRQVLTATRAANGSTVYEGGLIVPA